MLGLIQVSAWRSYLRKSGYLAYPKTPKDLCSLSGSTLDESITKLEETGLENENLYIKASCQQTNINLTICICDTFRAPEGRRSL